MLNLRFVTIRIITNSYSVYFPLLIQFCNIIITLNDQTTRCNTDVKPN